MRHVPSSRHRNSKRLEPALLWRLQVIATLVLITGYTATGCDTTISSGNVGNEIQFYLDSWTFEDPPTICVAVSSATIDRTVLVTKSCRIEGVGEDYPVLTVESDFTFLTMTFDVIVELSRFEFRGTDETTLPIVATVDGSAEFDVTDVVVRQIEFVAFNLVGASSTNLTNVKVINAIATTATAVSLGSTASVRIVGFECDSCLTTGGGAVNSIGSGSVYVRDALFKSCSTSANGGAINVGAVNLALVNVTCDGMTAGGHGGCLYLNGGSTTINDFQCLSPTTNTGYGGCIYVTGTTATVDITGFVSNTAVAGVGGSMYIVNSGVSVYGGVFHDSHGNFHGGTFYVLGSTGILSLVNSTVTSSDTAGNGGSVLVEGSGTIALYNSSIEESSQGGGYGGAISCADTSTGSITLENTLIKDCVSGDEGVVRVDKCTCSITGSAFIGNTGKGDDGILFGMGNAAMFVSSTRFINNGVAVSGAGWGGAITGTATDIVVSDCVFIGNTANRGGGAIGLIGASSLSLTRCHFEANVNNDGTDSGGALHVDISSGEPLVVTDSTFTDHTVSLAGGAIYSLNTDVRVSNITCTNNTAGSQGACLYAVAPSLDFNDSFIQNAAEYAAVRVVSGSLARVARSVFLGGDNCAALSFNDVATVVVKDVYAANFYRNSNGAFMDVIDASVVQVLRVVAVDTTSDNDGGAVYIEANDAIEIRDSQFVNNYALYSGVSSGGAIFAHSQASSCVMSVVGCSFTGARASAEGAGIFVGAVETVTVADCVFTDASGGTGGTIFFDDVDYLTITGSAFTSTTATGGGAIGTNGAPNAVEISNSVFVDSIATTGSGGAVFMTAGSLLLFNNSFVDCKATAGVGGGAVHYDNTPTTISGCGFEGGVAVNGGGVCQWGPSASLDLRNSSFVGNSASSTGGAVYSSVSTETTVQNCTFDGNSASRGGAIAYTSAELTASRCLFVGNTASDVGGGGGAVYATGSTHTDLFNIYRGNAAAGTGGGVSMTTSTCEFNNTWFAGNSASGFGGGFYVSTSGDVHISHSWLTGNTGIYGGGGYVTGATLLNATHLVVSGNSASFNGGGLFTDSDMSLYSSRVVSNTATRSGAFEVGSNVATVIDCDILSNIATLNGGVMDVAGGGTLVLHDGVVAGNTAQNGGAFYSGASSTISSTNTSFTANSASTSGGCFYIGTVASFSLSQPVAQGNCATFNGGFLYLGSSMGAVIRGHDSVFTDNCASAGGVMYVSANAVVTFETPGNVMFASNSASLTGGVLYVACLAAATVDADVVFTGNTANSGSAVAVFSCGSGAGVAFNGDVVVSSNTGTSDGAFAVFQDADVTFSGSLVATDNVGGCGSVFNMVGGGGGAITVTRGTITGSFSSGNGGVACIDVGSTLDVRGVAFDSNTATGAGGAVYTSASGLAAVSCNFTSNVAGGAGGAVFVSPKQSGVSIVHDCVFSDNSAAVAGGALAATVDPADGGGSTMAVSVSNSTIVGCQAPKGGGLHISYSDTSYLAATVSGTTFSDNSAGYGAAVYALHVSELKLDGGCVVDGNTGSGGLADTVFAGGVGSVLLSDTYVGGTPAAGVRVLVADSVAFLRVALEVTKGSATLANLAFVGSVSVIDSTLSAHAKGLALSLSNCNDVSFSRSLVGSSSPTQPALSAANTAINVTSSLFCSTYTARMACSASVAVSGDLAECLDTPLNCSHTCTSGLFCLQPLAHTLEKPIGTCRVCDGPCNNGSSGCTPGVSTCLDASQAPFYSCECHTGYALDGNDCLDINECIYGPNPCPGDFECFNTEGSFVCACAAGYQLINGTDLCEDINECLSGPCSASFNCTNTPGNYTCECPADTFVYNGSALCRACDSGWVVFDDQCVASCPGGYTPVNGTCVDVNECEAGSCPTGVVCTNTPGSFTCGGCMSGYFKYGGSTACRTCDPGYYIYSDVACLACPAGKYSPSVGATACTTCQPFSSSSAGSALCDCDEDYDLVANGTACVLNCPLGTYSVQNAFCNDCPVGSYGDSPGSCSSCPPLSTTSTTGSTSLSDCYCIPDVAVAEPGGNGTCLRLCPPGMYADEAVGGECLRCPVGTYSSSLDTATACDACGQTNAITPAPGATSSANCSCPDGLGAYETDPNLCTTWCPAGSARPQFDGECVSCGIAEYSDGPNQAKCSKCPAFTVSPAESTHRTDCSCKPGYYSRSGEAGRPCTVCPIGGKCRGGTAQPVAKAGFTPVGGASFHPCTPSEACVAGGDCAEGYTGERCAACEFNYHRVAGYCRPCGALAYVTFAAVLLGSLGAAGVLIGYNLRETTMSHAVTVVIAVNALQVAALFGRLDVEWPPAAQRVFDALSLASLNIELMAPECLSATETNGYFVRFFFTLSLPLIFAAVFAAYYGVLVCLDRLRDQGTVSLAGLLERLPSEPEFRRAVLQSMSQMVLVLYLPLSSTVFEFFDCVPSGVDGVEVVGIAPDVVCGEGLWRKRLGWAVVFTLLYPVGIPVALGSVLYYYSGKLSATAFAVRFGFVANRYRSGFYLYEVAVMVRKLGVAMCLTFITQSPYTQAGCAVAWMATAFVVHGSLNPYAVGYHNVFESTCTTLVEFVMLAGIMFQDSRFDSIGKAVVVITLVTLLLLVTVVGVGLDVAGLRRAVMLAGGGRDEDVHVDDAAGYATDGVVDSSVYVHASVVVGADGRDEDGRTYQVLASDAVFLQTKAAGSSDWAAVGESASNLQFCRDYSSLQYYIKAASLRGQALFEHHITVDAKYHVAGLRTHEIKFASGETVAITFKNIGAGREFAVAMAAALPPELGMLTGIELYRIGEDITLYESTATGGGGGLPGEFNMTLEEARARMADCVAAARASGHSLPQLDGEALEYVRDIGEGGFGAVKLYVLKVSSGSGGAADASDSGGMQVAVKVNTHEAEVQGFVEEAVQLLRLNHSNIIRLVGVNASMLALGMEFLDGGDVHSLIRSREPIDHAQRLFIAFETARALTHMHEDYGMAHRDIKPMNILLSSDRRSVKLADFGLAGDETMLKYGFTQRYAAPEQFDGRPGDMAADVYSFGATVYEVISGSRPFNGVPRGFGQDPVPTPDKLYSTDYSGGGELDESLHAELGGLIEHGMWGVDPDTRPSMRTVLLVLARALNAVDGGANVAAAELAAEAVASGLSVASGWSYRGGGGSSSGGARGGASRGTWGVGAVDTVGGESTVRGGLNAGEADVTMMGSGVGVFGGGVGHSGGDTVNAAYMGGAVEATLRHGSSGSGGVGAARGSEATETTFRGSGVGFHPRPPPVNSDVTSMGGAGARSSGGRFGVGDEPTQRSSWAGGRGGVGDDEATYRSSVASGVVSGGVRGGSVGDAEDVTRR